MPNLPLIRSHERIDYKRCPKKWFWKWRMGLVPKAQTFGALELGTWVHEALAQRYTNKRKIGLRVWFDGVSSVAISAAMQSNVPQHLLDAAEEIQLLGAAMTTAYDKRYGDDPDVHVIDAEVPLEFEITDNGKVVALHKLKPDLIYTDNNGDVWLMEHKTAKQIRLEHLIIDDQARPYVAMAELALRKAGTIRPDQKFRGIMYNFLRKALPDERECDASGKALNKNGAVSKRQPTPIFVRHPIELTRAQKGIALVRLRDETMTITRTAKVLRDKLADPARLPKTPHSSCPKSCQFFTMCVAEDQGGDIKQMQQTMYTRQNPYTYDEETTDIPPSFEMG